MVLTSFTVSDYICIKFRESNVYPEIISCEKEYRKTRENDFLQTVILSSDEF